MARFGEYEVPFTELRNNILTNTKEYVLPNGEVAIIPEEWFARYNHLFQFSQHKNGIRLGKYHVGLLNDISEHATLTMDRKIAELANFDTIDEAEPPKRFRANSARTSKQVIIGSTSCSNIVSAVAWPT